MGGWKGKKHIIRSPIVFIIFLFGHGMILRSYNKGSWLEGRKWDVMSSTWEDGGTDTSRSTEKGPLRFHMLQLKKQHGMEWMGENMEEGEAIPRLRVWSSATL